MSDPLADDDDKPLDPAAASIVARVRWLMLISGATTFIGVAAILGVIGYRVFKSEGSAAPVDMTARLPQGARVVSTAVAEDRLAVTIEVNDGTIEVRMFDLRTLRPVGRLRFTNP
jgi:hypothetical protein